MQLRGVTGRSCLQSSYSKDTKFNRAYSSSRPRAVVQGIETTYVSLPFCSTR